MNKVKKDPKVQLDKEKNFRVLLDAVHILELPITFDVSNFFISQISELACAKNGPILNLLQSFYKEYKKPSKDFGKGGEKQHVVPEPKMIKSYVGNLCQRQQSCQKEKEKRSNSNEKSNRKGSGKSLDAKINHSVHTQIQPLILSEKKASLK